MAQTKGGFDADDFVPQVDLSSSASELEARAALGSRPGLDSRTPAKASEKKSQRFAELYGSPSASEEGETLGYLGPAGGDEEVEEAPLGDRPSGRFSAPTKSKADAAPEIYLGGRTADEEDEIPLSGYLGGDTGSRRNEAPVEAYLEGEVDEAPEPRLKSRTDRAAQFFDGAVAGEVSDYLDGAAGDSGYLDGDAGDSGYLGGQAAEVSDSYFDAPAAPVEADPYGSEEAPSDSYYEEPAPSRSSGFLDNLESKPRPSATESYGGQDSLDDMFADIDAKGSVHGDSIYAEAEPYSSTAENSAMSSQEASRIIDAISKSPQSSSSKLTYDHFTEPEEGDYHTGTQIDAEAGPKLWEAGYQPAPTGPSKAVWFPVILILVLLGVGVGVYFGVLGDPLELISAKSSGSTFDPKSKVARLEALRAAERAGNLVLTGLTSSQDLGKTLQNSENKASSDQHRQSLQSLRKELEAMPQWVALDVRSVTSPDDVVNLLNLGQTSASDQELIKRFSDRLKESEALGLGSKELEEELKKSKSGGRP